MKKVYIFVEAFSTIIRHMVIWLITKKNPHSFLDQLSVNSIWQRLWISKQDSHYIKNYCFGWKDHQLFPEQLVWGFYFGKFCAASVIFLFLNTSSSDWQLKFSLLSWPVFFVRVIVYASFFGQKKKREIDLIVRYIFTNLLSIQT